MAHDGGSQGFSRREFLSASAVGLAGGGALASSPLLPRGERRPRAVIFILMTGGPSQLETFDPKPDASDAVRGPFRAIQTRVPGVAFSELFPRLAQRADRFSLIRTLHHEAPPIHEPGLQLLQTGRLADGDEAAPHIGAVVSSLLRSPASQAPWVRIPDPSGLGDTGVDIPRGCSPGWLSADAAAPSPPPTRRGLAPAPPTSDPPPTRASPTALRRKFPSIEHAEHAAATLWPSAAQRLFQRALHSVEQGARFVSLNMFQTVFGDLSWDMHASSARLWVSPRTYRDALGPTFDLCFSRLLDDLRDRGLLDDTLVVAAGEMGRMPTLNPFGGRDHWTRCWTALIAGGGVQGGRVVGTTDAVAGEPIDRPVRPEELVATIYHSLGIDPTKRIEGPGGRATPIAVAPPIFELF
jgi:hypothetical protein